MDVEADWEGLVAAGAQRVRQLSQRHDRWQRHERRSRQLRHRQLVIHHALPRLLTILHLLKQLQGETQVSENDSHTEMESTQ